MSPSELIDKAVNLMAKHLDQINVQATTMTKDGAKGFTTYDSQVIERYTKLLLTMTKTTITQDELDGLSDESLEALLREEQDNVSDTTSET